MIDYVAQRTIDTADYALGRPSTSTPSNTRGSALSGRYPHTTFRQFVHHVVHKSGVTVPVLLVALVYLDRAKPFLNIALEECAYERTFLGALIVADKVRMPHRGSLRYLLNSIQFCNDVTLKNIHWAICSRVFDKRDIGLIEREFLSVLDYELIVKESDLLAHYDAVMSCSRPPGLADHLRHPKNPRCTAENTDQSIQGSEPRVDSSQVKTVPAKQTSRPPSPSHDTPNDSITLPTQTSANLTSLPSTRKHRRSRSSEELHAVPSHSQSVAELPSASRPRPHTLRHFSSTLHILKSLAVPHCHHKSSKSRMRKGGKANCDDAELVCSMPVRCSVGTMA